MQSSKQELKNYLVGHFMMDQAAVILDHIVSLQILQPRQALPTFFFRSSQQFCVLIL